MSATKHKPVSKRRDHSNRVSVKIDELAHKQMRVAMSYDTDAKPDLRGQVSKLCSDYAVAVLTPLRVPLPK